MKNQQEFDKCVNVVDEDLLSAICLALRKAADSKAEKDWKLNKQSPLEDRRDC
jgi:hypothetical protein